MVAINLKGIAKVTAKGRTYYYAWRGGPRLVGEPGSPEFVASFVEARQNVPKSNEDRFRALVARYKASGEYQKLAASTKRQWEPWLSRIADYYGDLRLLQFGRPERIRPIIRQWRSRYVQTPRTADYGMQVLSRVLAHGVETGVIANNPCEGIKHLYRNDRSEIIWQDADIAEIKASNRPEIGHAVDLAATTGLREGDLLRLLWSQVRDDAIVVATGKSRGRREAIIPIYDELKDVLARIPRTAVTVLTNSRGRPWRTGFTSSFDKAKKRAGMAERDLNFNDLRGTAATRFYAAGIPERVIAEILGWEEEHVARIIRRYVSRSAATKELILQLSRGKRRT